jgi:hypothetical protein
MTRSPGCTLFREFIEMAEGFLRRKAAAEYLLGKYGFGAQRTLAKGVVTGDGPIYQKAWKLVLYRREDLDTWAVSKIGAPQRSSSDTARLPRRLAESCEAR